MNDLILVVDDEPKIVKLAQDYLEKNGYRVSSAGDGKTALAAFRHQKPDLIVLDLNLPGMDGLDVCRAIRRESDVPMIMLTARVDEIDRLIGLELGADDYITKPFDIDVLLAHVKAVLRRTANLDVDVPQSPNSAITVGGLAIDPAGRVVRCNGRPVELTPKEFDLVFIRKLSC